MIEWMVAILGQIHILIITLFFDMISGISGQMVIPHSPRPIVLSFAPDRLRHFYEQKFSNLKHSSSSHGVISKCLLKAVWLKEEWNHVPRWATKCS